MHEINEVQKRVKTGILMALDTFTPDQKKSLLGTALVTNGNSLFKMLAEEEEAEFIKELERVNKTPLLRGMLSLALAYAAVPPNLLYSNYFSALLYPIAIASGVPNETMVKEIYERLVENAPELLMVLMLEQQNFKLVS